MIYYEKAYNKEAIKHSERSIHDKPQLSACFVKTATNLSVCCEKLGFRDKALRICQSLRDKGVIQDPKLNNNMGVLFKREADFDRAMECFNNALSDPFNTNNQSFDSQDFFPLYNMAVSCTASKEYSKAMTYYYKSIDVISIDPKPEKRLYMINCYLNMALVCEFQHKFKESLHFINEALTLEKENVRGLQMKGRIGKIMVALDKGEMTLE